MALEFDVTGLPSSWQPWSRDALPLLAKRLGIEDYKAHIRLEAVADNLMPEFGMAGLDIEGDFGPVDWAQLGGALFLGKRPDQYRIRLCELYPWSRLKTSVCHEMVHARQWLTGICGQFSATARPVLLGVGCPCC